MVLCNFDEARILELLESFYGLEDVGNLNAAKSSLFRFLNDLLLVILKLPDLSRVHPHFLHRCSALQPCQAFIVDLDLQRHSVIVSRLVEIDTATETVPVDYEFSLQLIGQCPPQLLTDVLEGVLYDKEPCKVMGDINLAQVLSAQVNCLILHFTEAPLLDLMNARLTEDVAELGV